MMRSSLLASTIIVSSIVILSGFKSAQAATSTAQFNGTVAAACTFGGKVDGTLANSDFNGNGLDDSLYADQLAEIPVTCNNDFSLTLHTPKITSAPTGFNAANYTCYANVTSDTEAFVVETASGNDCTGSSSDTASVGTVASVNDANLLFYADMNTASGSDLPAGAYVMQVQVDATPN